jgi:replicative superfamily II helicase
MVMDELQLIGEYDRGANIEEILYMVKYSKEFESTKILGLSINFANIDEIASYLDAVRIEAGKDYKMVPFANGHPKLVCTNTFPGLEKDYGKTIIFLENKEECFRLAEEIKEEVNLLVDSEQLKKLERIREKLRNLNAPRKIYELIPYGLTCHSADLSYEVRTEIENSFKNVPGLKVLISTSTLAQGVNLPARTIIISLEYLPKKARSYYDKKDGCKKINKWSIDEIKLLNMIGRAGRPYARYCIMLCNIW